MLSEKVRKTSSENAGEVFTRRFFDFFWDALRETSTFETIFGRPWSETDLKSKRFVRGCPTKVKKTSRESAVPSQKRRPSQQKQRFWNTPGNSGNSANSAESAETVAAIAAQTPANTRAGGQDDGSYTNSLKLLLKKSIAKKERSCSWARARISKLHPKRKQVPFATK